MKTTVSICLCLMFLLSYAHAEQFSTLPGSPAKVDAAYKAAIACDFTFARDTAQVQRMIDQKLVDKLTGNEDYSLQGVSIPYVRPAGKLLIERLSHQFHKATGFQLVVTSTLRPQDGKLWNSSNKSVHPTGMAIDFRVPVTAAAEKWLGDNLLVLQSKEVLLVTREHNPPHFHVAVMCQQYSAYVAQKQQAKK